MRQYGGNWYDLSNGYCVCFAHNADPNTRADRSGLLHGYQCERFIPRILDGRHIVNTGFGEENIHLAMATLPIVYGIIPLLITPITWRLYKKKLAELE